MQVRQKFVAVVMMAVLCSTLSPAQSASNQRTSKRRAAPAQPAAVTAEDLKALRDAMAAQQEQIRLLQQQLQQREAAMQQALSDIRQAQTTAQEAQTRAVAAEQAATSGGTTVATLATDVADLKANQTNMALSTQDDQKRIVAAEGLLNRFRFSGDMRVRYENFLPSSGGCVETPTNVCNARHRARFRARFGVEGKINEDFIAGFFLASGDPNEPISTNQSLTSFFGRKPISVDRAYVTYNPTKFKKLILTGGKFAGPWMRTSMTFDSDLNHEGFAETIGFTTTSKFLQAVNLIGMQLLYNESSGGPDAMATGGQMNAKIGLGPRVTLNSAFTYLNWGRENTIAAARATSALVGNNDTNRRTGTGGSTAYVSGFAYADYIADFNIKTNSARFPVRVLFNYLKNVNAAHDEDTGIFTEFSVGQARNKGDFQVGYNWVRVEQDAVLAVFAESDFRNATNVLQHRAFFNYQIAANTTLAYTLFVGRTLDTSLPGANFASGITAGQKDPWLKRMQFDVIYKF